MFDYLLFGVELYCVQSRPWQDEIQSPGCGWERRSEAVEPRKPRLQMRTQVRPFTRASARRRGLRRQSPAPRKQRALRAWGHSREQEPSRSRPLGRWRCSRSASTRRPGPVPVTGGTELVYQKLRYLKLTYHRNHSDRNLNTRNYSHFVNYLSFILMILDGWWTLGQISNKIFLGTSQAS